MKRALTAIACVMLSMSSISCKKSELSAEERESRAKEAASAAAATQAPKDAGPSAEAGAAAPAGKTTSFAGKYTVTTGTMYVPTDKDWSSVKFKNDDSKLLGEGEMALTVDPTGRVSGSTESGPLGASMIEGTSDGSALAATIRRKDALDEGLTGTLVATISGDSLTGTMKLSEWNAAVVRVAKLEAKKK
jgi:hypothetical protein